MIIPELNRIGAALVVVAISAMLLTTCRQASHRPLSPTSPSSQTPSSQTVDDFVGHWDVTLTKTSGKTLQGLMDLESDSQAGNQVSGSISWDSIPIEMFLNGSVFYGNQLMFTASWPDETADWWTCDAGDGTVSLSQNGQFIEGTADLNNQCEGKIGHWSFQAVKH